MAKEKIVQKKNAQNAVRNKSEDLFERVTAIKSRRKYGLVYLYSFITVFTKVHCIFQSLRFATDVRCHIHIEHAKFMVVKFIFIGANKPLFLCHYVPKNMRKLLKYP